MRGPSSPMNGEHNSRRRPAYSGLNVRASVSSLFASDESDASEGTGRPHSPPTNCAELQGHPAPSESPPLRADGTSTPPRTPPRRGSLTPPNSPPPEKNFEGTPTPPDTPPSSPPRRAKATPSATPGRVLPTRTNRRAEPLPVEPPPVEPTKPEHAPVLRRGREKRYDLPPPGPKLAPQEGASEKPSDMVAKGATPENARWRMTPRMATAARKLGEAVSRRVRRESVQAARVGQQAGSSPLAAAAPAWPTSALFAPAPLVGVGPTVPSPPSAPTPTGLLQSQVPVSTPALTPARVPAPTPSLAGTPAPETAPPPLEAAVKTTALVATPECLSTADIVPPLSTAGVKRSGDNVLVDEASSSKRRRMELKSPSPSHTDDNAGNSANTSSGATAPTNAANFTATFTPGVTRKTENHSEVSPSVSASTGTKRTRRRGHTSAARPRDARGRFVSKRESQAAGEQAQDGKDCV